MGLLHHKDNNKICKYECIMDEFLSLSLKGPRHYADYISSNFICKHAISQKKEAVLLEESNEPKAGEAHEVTKISAPSLRG